MEQEKFLKIIENAIMETLIEYEKIILDNYPDWTEEGEEKNCRYELKETCPICGHDHATGEFLTADDSWTWKTVGAEKQRLVFKKMVMEKIKKKIR